MAPTNLFSIIAVFGSHFIVPGTCFSSKMQAACFEHVFGRLQLLYLPHYKWQTELVTFQLIIGFQRFASVKLSHAQYCVTLLG